MRQNITAQLKKKTSNGVDSRACEHYPETSQHGDALLEITASHTRTHTHTHLHAHFRIFNLNANELSASDTAVFEVCSLMMFDVF